MGGAHGAQQLGGDGDAKPATAMGDETRKTSAMVDEPPVSIGDAADGGDGGVRDAAEACAGGGAASSSSGSAEAVMSERVCRVLSRW